MASHTVWIPISSILKPFLDSNTSALLNPRGNLNIWSAISFVPMLSQLSNIRENILSVFQHLNPKIKSQGKSQRASCKKQVDKERSSCSGVYPLEISLTKQHNFSMNKLYQKIIKIKKLEKII